MRKRDHSGNKLWLGPRHERRKLKKAFQKINRNLAKLPCQFPQEDRCAGKIIESHSIQRAGALTSLCDRSNHVIRLQSHLSFDHPPKAVAQRIGINKASAFFALCAKHDHELFEPVENGPLEPDNLKHLFLIAYRGFLRDYYAKHREVVHYLEMKKFFSDIFVGRSNALNFVSRVSAEAQNGLRHFERLNVAYARAFSNSSWEQDFRFWYAVLSGPQIIAAGSGFTPEFDFAGSRINRSLDTLKSLNTVAITVCPLQEGTLISTQIKNAGKLLVTSLGRFMVSSLGHGDEADCQLVERGR